MKKIVDVVNFNSDASCLSCRDWLEILQGGNQSSFVKWLNLYVVRGRKVVLGFPGATVVDIAVHNPEAIDLINAHPMIFELILRPFSHDVALLRRGEGFVENVRCGVRVIENEFIQVTSFFLPPEFMLTNDQIRLLKSTGIKGTFVNSERFSREIAGRIPVVPYRIKGVFDSELDCIPFHGILTQHYLRALQIFSCDCWNQELTNDKKDLLFSWRDGESSFLLPDGLIREAFWLDYSDDNVEWKHLQDLQFNFLPNDSLDLQHYKSYPVHSFTAWMKEFRMLGYVGRVQLLEDRLSALSPVQRHGWLMTINSDILSAVEKHSPVVNIKVSKNDDLFSKLTILRSERGFEGEEYLSILEAILTGTDLPAYLEDSEHAYLRRWRGRMAYLKKIDG